MNTTPAPSRAELLTMLGSLAVTDAENRARGCSNPIRLRGTSIHVDAATGQVVHTYSSADERDGYTYARCGDRRAAVCPSCSHEYKGDAWHLLMCGLSGGKGVPGTVTEHPATFVTLTAPSFGPVHRYTPPRPGGRTPACRARRDRPVCPHGRPLSCPRRHDADDPQVGQPLCGQCYDYPAHVLWQWHAPELWRRFTIALRRNLARRVGITVKTLTQLARVSYTKVVEFQARGAIHIHAVIRLDGPTGPDSPPAALLDASDLEHAVHAAAGHVTLDVPSLDGHALRLRWGEQVDTRTITTGAGRDTRTGPAHPEQVAAYLAKYLTKSTEDFGLPVRVRSAASAAAAGATPHVVRIIDTAARLAATHEDYRPILRRLATLGYRGHPITKSRAYSVTFGSLRSARREWRHERPALDPDAPVREVLDADINDLTHAHTVIVLSEWTYAGRGYLDNPSAALAIHSAVQARTR
ncbi:replication initiator [Phytoactinopolyspora halotolerans]|uniref:Replication initiation protein n=1 Tax=Phytoactinopolyspora halotolerans TaxID=1981512 RepID=A0A6L9SBY0_9ACTN|nr:replication initiator [Phytoactinopolyspora halotolerans]NEE02071.1 replication initiation protein [Phytoactinopolyspora halotolerans]